MLNVTGFGPMTRSQTHRNLLLVIGAGQWVVLKERASEEPTGIDQMKHY